MRRLILNNNTNHIEFKKEKRNKHMKTEYKKFKNIIIEGADCTGKTTIINALKSESSYHTYTASKTTNFLDALQASITQLQYINKTNKILFERSFISELIYGIRFRNYTPRDELFFFDLLDKIEKDTLVIILTAPQKVLIDRYQKRGDSFVDATDILNIDAEYRTLANALANKPNISVLCIDTNAPISKIIEYIKQFMV